MSIPPDIVIAEFTKNRAELVRVDLKEFKGRPICDVRIWFRKDEESEWRATAKGVAIQVRQLPELAAAVNAALAAAVARGDVAGPEISP